MINFKKYISLNLLSLLGHLFFILCLVVVLFLFPQAYNYDAANYHSEAYTQYELFNYFFKIYNFTALFELFLLLIFITEFLFYKLIKKTYLKSFENKTFDKIYSVLFFTGIFFALIPLLLFFLPFF
ncbi:MAG: hypothetical protein PHX18_08410 [Candidatus Gastranaerophilales bacterium]|nr:hypothetical protein [Candidatus Gastranaerophilales bacterium]